MAKMKDLLQGKILVGMIHLPALPGAPQNKDSMDTLIKFATSQAEKLQRAGVDGCIIENIGDAPFFRESVPPITVAAMAIIVNEVKKMSNLSVGINILRNAWEEAFSIAHITGADFIRINVVSGAYATDQGIIEGCGAELARLKKALGSEVLVFGDVHVKHAYPLYDVPIEVAAMDLAERGGVDVVIVSGDRSESLPTIEMVNSVKSKLKKPVIIGSGTDTSNLQNLRQYYDNCDGLITDFKEPGHPHHAPGEVSESTYAEAVRLCRG